MAISWARKVMYDETLKAIQQVINSYERIDLLEISGERWTLSGNGSTCTRMNYPEFDICNETINREFDLVVAEQVFEHLAYPYRAGQNVYEMVRAGGCFLITVPFLYPVHNHPIDCTRWTATGLKYFLEEIGFSKVHTDSWGNRDCVMALGENPVDYIEGAHSLENDPTYPVTVWGLAKK